jgi:DNA-binding IclR family transcriptional regulator
MSIGYSDRIQEERGPVTAVRALSTAVKTLALLDHLATRNRPARLSEIAADLGVGRSTIYQRLVTLSEAGWVEQMEDGRFRLTMRAMRIAGAALEQADLGDRAQGVLRQVVAQAGETASLAVVQNHAAVIIQRVEAEGAVQARVRLGATMSLRDSASGRVLIAFAAPDEVEALTKGGVALPDEDLLADVRQRGIGIVAPHIEVGAVAAPVFDHRQRCIAALSLVGPRARFDAERLAAPTLAAADKLSLLLGGQPWKPTV